MDLTAGSYVQLLCNRDFLSTGRSLPEDLWKEEAIRILDEQEFVFIPILLVPLDINSLRSWKIPVIL